MLIKSVSENSYYFITVKKIFAKLIVDEKNVYLLVQMTLELL